MRKVILAVMAMIFVVPFSASTASAQTPLTLNFKLNLKVAGEGFESPVYVTNAGDDRLFVVEKAGRIVILKDGQVLPKPFLDIIPLVRSLDNERGLLSVAFHPKYKDNGL